MLSSDIFFLRILNKIMKNVTFSHKKKFLFTEQYKQSTHRNTNNLKNNDKLYIKITIIQLTLAAPL